MTTTETIAWIVSRQYGITCKKSGNCYILVALQTRHIAFYVQPFLLTTTLPVPLCPVQTLVLADIVEFLKDLPEHIIIVGDSLSRLITDLPVTMQVVSGIQPEAWAVAAVAAAREEEKGRLAPEPLYSRIQSIAPWFLAKDIMQI